MASIGCRGNFRSCGESRFYLQARFAKKSAATTTTCVVKYKGVAISPEKAPATCFGTSLC